MMYEIVEKRWFGKFIRFKVYEIGHSEGDREWVATFRIRGDAERYTQIMYKAFPKGETQQPVDW